MNCSNVREGTVVRYESLLDSFGDSSLADASEEDPTSPMSTSDIDPGLPRNDFCDFEKCVYCKTSEKHISYPYCSRCFTWKKNCYPSRPKKFKKYKNNLRVINEEGNKNGEQSGEQGGMVKKENSSDVLCANSREQSSGARRSIYEGIIDGPSTSALASSSVNRRAIYTARVCKLCLAKCEYGLFVHLNIAHLYACYRCAKALWLPKKYCPICRRKFSKIVKLIF